MKKILVIDGNSIINRAFYGVKLLSNKNGVFTNAVHGTASIVARQLEAVKPDYCAVAFDLKHPTFRHEMYPEYKAGRRPTPPELLSQFGYVKEMLALMGMRVCELPGWEADDIQGTVARMARDAKEPTESYILSGDRDLLQLIDDKTSVLLATNSDTLKMGREQFREKYGIEPESFVDMKALMGDSSDNIPGVGGIGEKTAASLISNFTTLEGIYDNIDDSRISKGVREKLLRDKDNAYLSRTLARIDVNAPLDFTLEDIAYKGWDKAGLYRLFSTLELKSLIVKFGLDRPDESGATAIEADVPSCTEASAEQICAYAGEKFAIMQDGELSYIYIKEENFIYKGSLSALEPIFKKGEAICYGGKDLFHALADAGVDTEGIKLLDVSVYEYLLDPGTGNAGVPSLSAMFLGRAIPATPPCPSALYELESALMVKIKENGLEKVLFDIELPLIPILTAMERTGFKIDPAGINEFSVALGELADDLAERIYMQAGEVFNINSPKQLGEVLYEKLGLAGKRKKGKTGYSTDAQTLEELRQFNPIIDDVLEYRQVTKLKGTYTDALTAVADENGRIHTDFKQTLTATGRLSSADPNLQNIPIKTKMGREMRRFFIAREGYSLVDADYSQIELRLLAHISDDYNMCEAFKSGEDIHRKTAAAVFGVPEEYVNEEMRKRAKAVNFGIVYGISGFSLSKDIGTTVAEASKYIKNYLMNYPLVDAYLENVVKEAEKDGYTTTLFGRRRYIPEFRDTKAQVRAFGKRVAMNAPIQGSAADVMKLAMIAADRMIKEEKLDAYMVMQVHDELILEVRDDQVDKARELLKRAMEEVCSLSVPLTVDVTSGKNWLEQS